MKTLIGAVTVLLISTLALTACGGSEKPPSTSAATSSFVSPDAGPTGLQAAALVMDPGHDPRYAPVLFAGTPMGLFKSSDRAASWQRVTTLGDGGVVWAAVDPSEPSALYAIHDEGGAAPRIRWGRSDDGGDTWVDLTERGAPQISGYMGVPWLDVTTDPSTLYTWGLRGEEVLLFRSADRGETWTTLRGAQKRKAEALRGTGSPDPVPHWIATGPVLEIAGEPLVDPFRPWTVYAGTMDGVYKSLDGGRTWRKASAGL